MGCVYRLLNTCTGMSYIGYTTCPIKIRMRKHKNDDPKSENLLIGHAISEYGWGFFTYSILYESDDIEKLLEKERYYIKELNTLNPNGYNMTAGGRQLFGEENPFYGKKHSEKTKRLLSEFRSTCTAEKNSFYGKHHSEKTKALIRAKKARPVEALKDGKVVKAFNSIFEASQWCIKNGLTNSKHPSSDISAGCRYGNKAFGYNWRIIGNEGVETKTDECKSVE